MSNVRRSEWQSGAVEEDATIWKDQLAGIISRILAVTGVVALLVLAYLAGDKNQLWYMAIYVPVYLFLLVISFVRGVSYRVRILTVIGIGGFFALLTMAIFGINAESAYMLLTIVVLSTLFEGQKGGYVAVGLCAVGLAVLAWLFVSGRLVVRPNYTIRNNDPSDWALTIAFFLAVSIGVLWALNFILRRLSLLLAQRQQVVQELERSQAELEQQVADRTDEISRHNARLQSVVQITRELVIIQELDRLMSVAVNMIRERLDQVTAALWLLDESKNFLILQAATTVDELPMPEPGWQIHIDEADVLGEVVRQGRLQVVPPDVTRAVGRRIMLPLLVRDQPIGVLEVQSHIRDQGFDEQDLIGWQVLSDQLAVAVDNIRLRMRLEQSLLAERQAYAALTREGWQKLLSARPDLGFVRNRRGILPMDKRRQAKETVWPEEKPLVQASAVTLPIRVRDQVIGRLDARKPKGATWLPQEIELLETLIRELNDALENARLYQDTQRREAEQRLIGQVAAEVRHTLDIDTVLQTAIREIGKALSLSQVEVRLSGPTVPVSKIEEEHS